MSGMLGWIIQLYKLVEWGDQTSVTPVLETEQISSPLFVNSFIAAATEAQASEHINQPRDYIHLSHGHSSLHTGPASCWHCLCLCCLPLLLLILTVLPIRRAGEKATNLEGCWVCCQREACLALGAVDKRGFYVCTLMWGQISSSFHIFIWLNCIFAPKYKCAEVTFYRLINIHTRNQKLHVNTTSKAWQVRNKAGQNLWGLTFCIYCALHIK